MYTVTPYELQAEALYGILAKYVLKVLGKRYASTNASAVMQRECVIPRLVCVSLPYSPKVQDEVSTLDKIIIDAAHATQ